MDGKDIIAGQNFKKGLLRGKRVAEGWASERDFKLFGLFVEEGLDSDGFVVGICEHFFVYGQTILSF